MIENVRYGVSLFTDHDIYLFKEGNHFRLYEKLGSHVMTVDGIEGNYFAVWAPNALRVSVVGEFNGWNPESHPLRSREDGSGIWEGFITGVGEGAIYKYHIVSQHNNYRVDKGDPFAFCWEPPPKTASRVWDLKYEWGDGDWMENRHKANALDAPLAIYEIHLGSWRRALEDGNRFLTYREIAESLSDYVNKVKI